MVSSTALIDELITIHGITSIPAGHSYLAEKGVTESVIRCGAEPCSTRSGDTSPQSPITSLKSSDNLKSFNNCLNTNKSMNFSFD